MSVRLLSLLRKIIFTKIKVEVKYLLPVIVAIFFTACTKGTMQNTLQPYDFPPGAPIPPVDYCFESTIDKDELLLRIEGDSAFGKLVRPKSENQSNGSFTGIIYGKTLIVNYKLKTDKGWQTEEQQWRFSKDSIFKINKQAGIVNITRTFYRVPCR